MEKRQWERDSGIERELDRERERVCVRKKRERAGER